MDPKEIDMASQAIAKAPRVALDDIKAAMMAVYYTDGENIAQYAQHADFTGKERPFPNNLEVLTICMVVMKNGFIVIGKSAPASPENYNMELGRKFAHDDAIKQLWPLMGFALKDRVTRSP